MEAATETISTVTLIDRENSLLQNNSFQHSHHHYLCLITCNRADRGEELFCPKGSDSVSQADNCTRSKTLPFTTLGYSLSLNGTTQTGKQGFIAVLQLPSSFLSLPNWHVSTNSPYLSQLI